MGLENLIQQSLAPFRGHGVALHLLGSLDELVVFWHLLFSQLGRGMALMGLLVVHRGEEGLETSHVASQVGFRETTSQLGRLVTV